MIREYVADFETTSVRVYKEVKDKYFTFRKLDGKKSKAFVCAWGMAGIEATKYEEVETGRSIESFLAYVEKIAQENGKDRTNIFTHNLKFDASFIIFYVLTKNHGEISNEVRDNSLYSFDYKFPSGAKVTFRASDKIFTCSVAELGKLYGIQKLKGDWDYNKYRDEYTEISEDEWQYVRHDVLIVCKALKDYRDKGYSENTLAAIAYNKRLKMTYPKFNKSLANRFKNRNYEAFVKAFPYDIKPLPEELHISLLNAYYGGWTYLNPLQAGREIENVHSFDVNSMYPHKMKEAVLPIGEPILIKNPTLKDMRTIETIYPCKVYHFNTLSIELRSKHHLPMMMFPTFPETSVRCQGKVLKCKDEDVWLTNIDLEMMQKEYIIKKASIDEVIAFKGKKGQYEDFVNYFIGEKNEATIKAAEYKASGDIDLMLIELQRRDIAKKMLNSSYGKDGTKLWRETKTSKIEDGLLEFDRDVEKTVIEYFIPSAVFICSYARKQLYDFNKTVGDAFIYSDTDSSKITADGLERVKQNKTIKVDDVELGAWKHEHHYRKAKFVRQKTYATLEGEKWEYTVCGATADVKKMMRIEDFQSGMIITLEELHEAGLQGKLIPISVEGGVILEETAFQIKEETDWYEIGSKNLPISKFESYMDELERKRRRHETFITIQRNRSV